jgi:processive 1,2-diacylglycerol beta-glucosyltransferase
MPRKILLASINVGGGHTALRDSFHLALERVDPDKARYEPLDWDSADTFINHFYSTIVYRVPRLQGVLFDLSERTWAAQAVAATGFSLLREARRVLSERNPDAVLCTHFLLAMMLAKARHQLKIRCPVLSAIPDYGIPPRSFYPSRPELRADYLVVMDERARAHCVDRGLPPERVHLSGFLTREPFRLLSESAAPGELRSLPARQDRLQKLALSLPQVGRIDLSRPTLLFLGGSAWARKTAPLLRKIASRRDLELKMNLVVVCGKDRAFFRELNDGIGRRPDFTVLQFISSSAMSQLMGLADYPVLGSLAPATLQELLETGCGPLLLFNFIPGTERPHVEYIERNSLGIYQPDVDHMLRILIEICEAPAGSSSISQLREGFRAQAGKVRRANVERALAFPEFLDQVLAGDAPSPAGNG